MPAQYDCMKKKTNGVMVPSLLLLQDAMCQAVMNATTTFETLATCSVTRVDFWSGRQLLCQGQKQSKHYK